jgi:hypothetical protein
MNPMMHTTIRAGLPALVRVDDYEGLTERHPSRYFEWTLCDLKGREAPWMKPSQEDRKRIDQELEAWTDDLNNPY